MRITFLFFLFLATLPIAAKDSNEICIEPYELLSGDVAGGRNWKNDTNFSFTIGETEVSLSESESVLLSYLSNAKSKYLVIKKDLKPYSAIYLSSDIKKQPKSCLWLSWPHATWQISPLNERTTTCECFK